MTILLRDALVETTANWRNAIPKDWRTLLKNVDLDTAGVPKYLQHDPWVPIFPVFKNHKTGAVFPAAPSPRPSKANPSPNLIGIPYFAHTFRALLVPPDQVKVVIVGQDPYPDIADATGQSFEQGSITNWIKDAHLVAGSLKPILQTAVADARKADHYRKPRAGWQEVVDDIKRGTIKLASPPNLFPAYQRQGVLWLNTTLTISLFRTTPRNKKKGFQEGHAAYWKPFVSAIFKQLVSREDKNVVFALWGKWAKDFRPEIQGYAEQAHNKGKVSFVEAGHPVTSNFLTRPTNPLTEVNDKLRRLGEKPIRWAPAK